LLNFFFASFTLRPAQAMIAWSCQAHVWS